MTRVDAVRYSFIVMDLHHLLLAGLPAHSGLPIERTSSGKAGMSQRCQTRKWHRYSTASSIDGTKGQDQALQPRSSTQHPLQSTLLGEERNPLRPSTGRD